MKRVSYDSEELINNVREDIELFGKSFRVYAIYSYREDFDFEYISGYVDADEPTIDELGDPPYSSEDIADYEKLLADFKTNKKSLAYTKHKLMTLDKLLALLEKQDRIF